MNLVKMLKGQYPEDLLQRMQVEYNRMTLLKARSTALDDVVIDPIEELPFPASFNSRSHAISWAFEHLGTDQFIDDNWERLVNSPIHVVFVVHDTAGRFNEVTKLNHYENIAWSGDNTGTGQDDDHDHGHMVAGVIGGAFGGHQLGILRKLFEAGKCSFVADKVMSRGSGQFSWIANGINRTANINYPPHYLVVHVNSYGAGGVKSNSQVDAAIQNCLSKGQLFLASSGNSGNDPTGKTRVGYPAVNKDVIAVGAVDQQNNRKGYSSTGPEVYSTSVSGVPSVTRNGAIRNVEGTSFSQPIQCAVVGLVALYLGRKINQNEAKAILANMGTDLGAVGRDPEYGFGIVTANNIGEEPGDEPEDQPDDPEDPPQLPAYTAKITIPDLTEMWRYQGEQEVRRVQYRNYHVEVRTTEPLDTTTRKVGAIMRDWMSRHFVEFPVDWGYNKVVGYLSRVTDRHLTERYGYVADVTLVDVAIGVDSFTLSGDELSEWKTAPSKQEIAQTDLIVIDAELI